MGSTDDLDYFGLFSGYVSLVYNGRRIRSEGTDIPVTITCP